MEEQFYFLCRQLSVYARKSMDCIDESDKILMSNNPDRISVAVYLNQALSLINSAQVIYFTQIEELEHNDIKDFFDSFDSFVRLTLSSTTEHYIEHIHFELDALRDEFHRCVLSQCSQ